MSALVGAGVGLLLGVLADQQLTNGLATTPMPEIHAPELAPHPRDYVRIVEGRDYIVPYGKILVPTAMGWLLGSFLESRGGKIQYSIFSEGKILWKDATWGSVSEGATGTSNQMTVTIPIGLAIPGNRSVSAIVTGTGVSRAVILGYLVDA